MENETKKDIMFKRMKEKKKEVKIVRRIVLAIVLIVLIGGGITAYSGYKYVKSALQPVDEKSEEIIPVKVEIGSNLDSIAALLEKNEIIKDARIFKYYAKFNNESDFQAGDYGLTKSMTFDELIESLKSGKVYREPIFSMTIPEGRTLEEIAARVEEKTSYTSKEFLDLVTNPDFIDQMIAKYPNILTEDIKGPDLRHALEGYLFPATYAYYEENPSLESIVDQMLSKTANTMAQYTDQLAEEQKSVHWLLTFASLLEEEATADTDREMIASVFNNRMEKKMPLQTDPTVLYALGEHKDRVLYDDLEIDHPYNTYKIQGLPPGPISNPGTQSIEAVLNAPESENFYFLADKEGVNHFSKTYDEHLAKIEQYLR
ncbi:endolytic transglycosylase MltG [Paenisporosarcina quisquiliarum]|uniref:Endolytic murein transglycosylase n=1 Tax=Paenisporosarcina quisquiliarum TaxID=365346 RepID=A0A9X3LDY9_9BACL|nr:endolytic transglycosylase MltG [Paenisporosarcina quisquiliarum]